MKEIKAKIDHLDETVRTLTSKFEDHIKDDKTVYAEIVKTLAEIKGDLTRYRGFIGGVLFAVTTVWTFLVFFKGNLIDWVRALGK